MLQLKNKTKVVAQAHYGIKYWNVYKRATILCFIKTIKNAVIFVSFHIKIKMILKLST